MGSPIPRSVLCLPSCSQHRPTELFQLKGKFRVLCGGWPPWAVLNSFQSVQPAHTASLLLSGATHNSSERGLPAHNVLCGFWVLSA